MAGSGSIKTLQAGTNPSFKGNLQYFSSIVVTSTSGGIKVRLVCRAATAVPARALPAGGSFACHALVSLVLRRLCCLLLL